MIIQSTVGGSMETWLHCFNSEQIPVGYTPPFFMKIKIKQNLNHNEVSEKYSLILLISFMHGSALVFSLWNRKSFQLKSRNLHSNDYNLPVQNRRIIIFVSIKRFFLSWQLRLLLALFILKFKLTYSPFSWELFEFPDPPQWIPFTFQMLNTKRNFPL